MASKEQLVLLRQFVELCKHNPDVIHLPELAFYKEFLESLGAKLPPPPASSEKPKQSAPTEPSPNASSESAKEEPMPDLEDSDPESDLDLDTTGVVEPDQEPPLPMGDPNKEATDDMIEQSNDKRSEAMAAVSDGKLDEAIKLFTEAIELNPGSALLHAKRANALLQMNKPNAAIRDCDKAISINPDSAQGYKFRGRAHRLLGHFDKAYADFATACKLDYDDQTNGWMKEIDANAKKILEHKRKQERKKEEREEKKREQRRKSAKEAYEKAKKEQAEQRVDDDDDMGDMGGMPGGGMGGLPDLFNDPEIMAALQDPEVMQAFADVSQNPMNMAKYSNNPKVKKVLEKMASKMSGGGGMPGGMFGGAGGPFGGAGGPFGGGAPGGASGCGTAPPHPKPDIDID